MKENSLIMLSICWKWKNVLNCHFNWTKIYFYKYKLFHHTLVHLSEKFSINQLAWVLQIALILIILGKIALSSSPFKKLFALTLKIIFIFRESFTEECILRCPRKKWTSTFVIILAQKHEKVVVFWSKEQSIR